MRNRGRQNGKTNACFLVCTIQYRSFLGNRLYWCQDKIKTACTVSALVCHSASLAWADLPVNFGGTESNARSRIDILAGLFLGRQRILPIVMSTGQAFLSPEKLVRCVWSDNPIMGTTVDPGGRAFYQGTEWAVSTGNTSPKTCQNLSHTCVSHHQSAVCISEYNCSPLESYSRIGA